MSHSWDKKEEIMKRVVFIGHHECYGLATSHLRAAIRSCICQGITDFYNGGQGGFDRICARCVFELKTEFPHIQNILVIPYTSFRIFNPALFDEIFSRRIGTIAFQSCHSAAKPIYGKTIGYGDLFCRSLVGKCRQNLRSRSKRRSKNCKSGATVIKQYPSPYRD